MKKNPMLSKALALLKEWQGQLGQGDRPDLDACIKQLEQRERALVLDVPQGEVTCLIVAISNHGHEMLAGAERETTDMNLREIWQQHGFFLNSLKEEIKRQYGRSK